MEFSFMFFALRIDGRGALLLSDTEFHASVSYIGVHT